MKRKSIIIRARYLLEALLILPIYLIFQILPFRVSAFIIGKLLKVFGRFHPANRIAIKNLNLAFPEKSIDEIREIAKNSWENLGKTAGSFVGITKLSKKEIEELSPIQNKHFVEEAQKNSSGGIIIVSAHTGNWEIGSSYLNALVPNISMIYRHANNPFVEKLIAKNRKKYSDFIIRKGDKSGFRDIYQHLKNGGSLAIVADQKIRDGVEVNFFGQVTKAPSTPAELALRFNLPIVMGRNIALENGKFLSSFEKPIYPENKSVLELTQEIYNYFERWIREYPDQWFWMHNRWYLRHCS
ncbi:MAG: lysophospholipid acyltransferase family protein [Rickettsiales bacterium]|nr:lysophospholipid acyltransferase family protein [Rickettsiales bacterium]